MKIKILDLIAKVFKIKIGWSIGHYGEFGYTFYRMYYIFGKRFDFKSYENY